MIIDIDNNNKSTIDMLLLSIPWWDMFIIPCGPPVLKGIAESHGYNLKILDCNRILKHEFCDNNQQKYFELESYFCHVESNSSTLVDNFYKKIVDTVIDITIQNNVRYVAFSVFSVYTQKAAFELIQKLKNRINVPIVVGGRGLSTKSNITIHDQLTSSEKMINFVDVLRKRQLIKYAIEGDGEDAVVELLSGNIDQSYDKKFTAKSNSLEYPFSNFDDYHLDNYKFYDKIQLPVVSSKGCVRSCDFCDVGAQMAKFQSKNGDRLAKEMIFLSKKYHVNEFASADSIANGNLKELRNTVNSLVSYNSSVGDDEKISWTGNWICRPRNSLKPEFFDLLKKSGCKHLTIGAEHGSDRVLSAMDKKTDVDGFQYEIEQIHRVGMQCGYNSIVGHWSELFEDFKKLIEMWIWTGPYVANRSVTTMSLSLFAALENTPAINHTNLNQLVKADDNFTLLWYSKVNPTLTLKTKLIRYLILIEIAVKLNMPVDNILNRINVIADHVSNDAQISKYNDFFEKVVDTTSSVECEQTLNFFKDIMHNVDAMISTMYPTTELSITLTSESVNGDPRLLIVHNNLTVYDQTISEGCHTITLSLPNDFENTNFLKFSLPNKMQSDTVIDADGTIIKDKFIKFENIIIDKVDVVNTDIEFFYKTNSSPGLYSSDQSILIEYQAPFWKYFIKNTPNYTNWHNKTDVDDISRLINSVGSKLNQLKY